MLTETEAKTKWCPYSGTIIPMFPPVERGFCIASACMMWRQAQKPNPDWRQSSMASYPMPNTRFDPPMYINGPERGYCGLAGRP